MKRVIVTGLLLLALPGVANAAIVNGPKNVTPGKVATFHLSDFLYPGASRVTGEIQPAAHRGGNCCGYLFKRTWRKSASGKATVRVRWPSHWSYCVGATSCTRH